MLRVSDNHWLERGAVDHVTALRVGFEEGLYTRNDVVRWVDAALSNEEHLHDALLELATMSRMSDVDVVANLRSLENNVRLEEITRARLQAVAELLRAGRAPAGQIVSRLEAILNDSETVLDSDQRARIVDLICAYELANYGTYGSVNDVERELGSFLATYAGANHE